MLAQQAWASEVGSDPVVVVDPARHVVLRQIMARPACRLVRREPCCNGNYETIACAFSPEAPIVRVSMATSRANRQRDEALMNDSRWVHLRWVRLGSRRDIDDWLVALPRTSGSGQAMMDEVEPNDDVGSGLDMNDVARVSAAGAHPDQPIPYARGGGTDRRHSSQISTGFEAFYTAERVGLVKAVALVEGSPAAAADLVDEAMLRAYQRWSQVSTLDRPAGWVYRVAINLGRSRFRRARREVRFRWLSRPDRSGDLTSDDAFASSIADSRLMSAILALPVAQREVLVARVLLDYSERDVAAALELSPGTVKSRLSRALATLRKAVPDLAAAVDDYQPTNSTTTNTDRKGNGS